MPERALRILVLLCILSKKALLVALATNLRDSHPLEINLVCRLHIVIRRSKSLGNHLDIFKLLL